MGACDARATPMEPWAVSNGIVLRALVSRVKIGIHNPVCRQTHAGGGLMSGRLGTEVSTTVCVDLLALPCSAAPPLPSPR